MTQLKIAVLFDGAGLARLGLEQAGHLCTGFELSPVFHYLSQFVGSGNSVLANVKELDYSEFDAAWASPPCQELSSAAGRGEKITAFSENLLGWALTLGQRYPNLQILWVENVLVQESHYNKWGTAFNAAQFLQDPIQNRNRVIGGYYPTPYTLRPYKKAFPGICPCITGSEDRSSPNDKRRAGRFYGRRLTIEECAFHQGFKIPSEWYKPALGLSQSKWRRHLYQAIGNGVPVYMARAFGEAAAGY